MRSFAPVFFIILFQIGSVWVAANEEKCAHRIHQHMILHDYRQACAEGREALKQYPDSEIIWQSYLQALAKSNDERTLWEEWGKFTKLFPHAYDNRDILENLSWGVIENASNSSSPVIRIMALLGAFLGQDAKGVGIMAQFLRDSNSFVRATAVKLSSNMRDAQLQDEVLKIFQNDRNWKVHLEAIKAVGKMHIAAAKPALVRLISDNQSMAEEKAASITSLVGLLDTAEREEVSSLVHSDRAGLRLLATEIVKHFELNRDSDQIAELLYDNHPEVRASALHTMGVLRVDREEVLNRAVELARDNVPEVAVTAAWYLIISKHDYGQSALCRLLNDEVRTTRHLAAGALAASGKNGLPLMLETFGTCSDFYVRMNLAIGLLGQRTAVNKACDALYEGLMDASEKWMIEDEGFFPVLTRNNVKHDEDIPNQREAVNQMARLQILNMLAVMGYPKAQDAIRKFLQEKTWGITGLAAALLLTEGDDSAIDLVENLLNDPEHKIRVQAALILALWGRGEGAIAVLRNAYDGSDKEMKEKIIEGLGRIGAASTIQFLTEKLQEPYQTTRIIAAAALLECLYH